MFIFISFFVEVGSVGEVEKRVEERSIVRLLELRVERVFFYGISFLLEVLIF